MRKLPVAASLWFVIGACSSSSPFDPGSGDSPGTGTSTLVVNGSASAQPSVANATMPADFVTSFSVQITLANVPVTTGTVTMTSASGPVSLTFQPAQGTGGRWQASGAGYEQVYQLDVVSGADTVKGVRVDGPDIHTFASPTAGAVVDSSMALSLGWNRGASADAAVVRLGDGGSGSGNGITIPDSGSYTMAAASLKSSKDKPETSTIRLTRTNRVALAGAAAGSELAVSVANTLTVVAQPNPSAP